MASSTRLPIIEPHQTLGASFTTMGDNSDGHLPRIIRRRCDGRTGTHQWDLQELVAPQTWPILRPTVNTKALNTRLYA